MKFCITGLPRSRTAWFAAYFTATGNKCAHEPFAKCETEQDIENVKRKYVGISDSFMLFVPYSGKRVVIIRDEKAVKQSLFKGFGMDLDVSDRLISQASDILKYTEGLRVEFDDINDRLQEIHEYCVDTPYDEDIGNMFKNLNIQVNKLEFTEQFKELIGGVLCQHGQ